MNDSDKVHLCIGITGKLTRNFFLYCSDYAAQKNEDGTSVKPWISLSGDDNGRHYILYPSS